MKEILPMSVDDTNSVESSFYDEESEDESVYEKDEAYDYVEEEEEEEDDDDEYIEKVTKRSKMNNRQSKPRHRSSNRINSKRTDDFKDDELIINASVRKETVPIIQYDDDDEEASEEEKDVEVEESQDVEIAEEEEEEEEEDDDIEIPEVSETPMPEDVDDKEEEEEEENNDEDTTDYGISLDINSKESTADIPKRIVRSRMLKDILDYSDTSNKQEELLTEEEIQLRKAENARKRKNLKDKKLEEEKRDTINKLLRKRAGKARSRQQGNDDESLRSSSNKDGTSNGTGNGKLKESMFHKPRRPYLTDGMTRIVINAENILYCPRD